MTKTEWTDGREARFDILPNFSPQTEKDAIEVAWWLWECSDLIAAEIARLEAGSA